MRTAHSTLRHRIRVSDDTRYLTIGQVRERFGVPDMWVWCYMRRHNFPKPVQFAGPTSARHWRLTEIEDWESKRTMLANVKSRNDSSYERNLVRKN
jgi:predicted DNA-binding transcriptional regulator AlpA